MKIWIDILTPKQTLFFEPLIKELRKKHKLMITSRDYREAKELIKSRKMKAKLVGKHGGGTLWGKLQANIQRMKKLNPMVHKFNPDLAISFCSPDCSNISFALGIKHYVYCNAPHSSKVMKLSLPLVDKLFCPKHIPKEKYTIYGIDKDKIFQYNALDEYIIVNNKSIKEEFNFKKRIILIRTVESQASYRLRKFDFNKLIKKLYQTFPDHELVILPRYYDEIKILKGTLSKYATIMTKVVDSKSILEKCDVFIGSGGTMTSEAVMRGIPSISCNTAPNDDERYLVSLNLLPRRETISGICTLTLMLMWAERNEFKKQAERFMRKMENPHAQLLKELN